jgi:S1-C subfamily serine protease
VPLSAGSRPFITDAMSTTLEQLSNDLSAAVDRASLAVVAIHARRRIPATGVHWRQGVIVAANHTVQKDDDIAIAMGDGSETRGRVTGRDATTDLCIIAVETEGVPARIDVSPLRVGQLTLSVGRPGSTATASLGVVSAVGPEWRTARGGRIDQFVRLDMSVYDGFSGSPLVTAAGDVAGLCTSGLTRGGAIAVPAKTVERVVTELQASGGNTRRGFLGISTQLVPLPDSIKALIEPLGGRVPRSGLMVVSVQAGTSADRAGILLGDLLVGLGGEPMEDPRDVFAALGPDTVGRDMQATIIRAGHPLTLNLTIDEHPERG